MTSETIISNSCVGRSFIPLLAFVLIISACEEVEAPPSGSDPEASTVAAAPEEVLVEIDLDEYTVIMDAVLPAGPVSVKFINRGFEEHNLLFVLVESDSTVWETERRLNPGERRTVRLEFEPGEYKAICNFSGHEDRGMFTEFAVEETTPSEGGSER